MQKIFSPKIFPQQYYDFTLLDFSPDECSQIHNPQTLNKTRQKKKTFTFLILPKLFDSQKKRKGYRIRGDKDQNEPGYLTSTISYKLTKRKGDCAGYIAILLCLNLYPKLCSAIPGKFVLPFSVKLLLTTKSEGWWQRIYQ